MPTPSVYVLIGNCGNASLAALQWLIEQQLSPTYLLTVDTGWAATGWQQHVDLVQAYAKKHQVTPVRLQSPHSFQQLVSERKAFPAVKYQWCAGLLKGLVMNDWLDEIDPQCQATLVMGKQRLSRRDRNLPEFIEESEHYHERRIWHPLYQHSRQERDQLISKTGFPILSHRSLECDPCIHAHWPDFRRVAAADITKTTLLEKEINQAMFPAERFDNFEGITALVQAAKTMTINSDSNFEEFSMGCGSPWGCGE